MKIRYQLLGILAAIGLAAGALAQTNAGGNLVPNAPLVQSIGPNDAFQDVVGGFPQAGNYYATAAQVGGYGSTLFGGNYDNALIGGDFSTNLFQRGTSVSTSASTYYVAYGADRWFTWGGTSTPTTMTQQTGASDIPVGVTASYRINKGSLTGVAQICTSQVLEGANAVRFQGQTAEFAFDAKAGSTFSAASSNLAVYVSTGTVVDEGATKMAYGLNATGGSGTTAWTGQANLGGTAGYLIPITTTWGRYGVAVPIPVGALEIGVSICYTPVGTGTATDWFEFAKAAFTANPAVTAFAGTAGAAYNLNDNRMKSFARRAAGLEALLQYRYYWRINEANTAGLLQSPGGYADTTSTCSVAYALPSAMRVTPTIDLGNLSATTFKVQVGLTPYTPIVLATPFALIQVGNTSTTLGAISFKTAASQTVGVSCELISTAAGAGNFGFVAEL